MIAVGACISLGAMQWSLFQQQQRIETSIHDLEEQGIASSAVSEKTLNELLLNIEKEKSSTKESLKEINKKYQADIALLQTSFDEIKNAHNELETFFKEKMEIIFEEINIIKSRDSKNNNYAFHEKFMSLNDVERKDVARLISGFMFYSKNINFYVRNKKTEELENLFFKDAVIETGRDQYSPKSYINLIKNKFLDSKKTNTKIMDLSVFKDRYGNLYHAILNVRYSLTNNNSEKNGQLSFLIHMKYQGTNLKINYIREVDVEE